jgi:hypothetical protein
MERALYSANASPHGKRSELLTAHMGLLALIVLITSGAPSLASGSAYSLPLFQQEVPSEGSRFKVRIASALSTGGPRCRDR